jgi:Fe-S cluster assembly ATP-binding protein
MNTLAIKNLAVSIEKTEILHGVSCTVHSKEVHVIMGPNGSGKSTLASALLGHPAFFISKTSSIQIGNQELSNIPSEKRAIAGLFLAFQSPIAIPGVTVMNLLRTSYQELNKKSEKKLKDIENPVLSRRFDVGGLSISDFMDLVKKQARCLSLDESFLHRGINDGFSGGEKKKVEMLQALVLAPKFAVFDEIDTGLDVDALKAVAGGIEVLRKQGTGVVIITHYQRILKYVHPDVVHILVKGNIVKTGSSELVKQIEKFGYKAFT